MGPAPLLPLDDLGDQASSRDAAQVRYKATCRYDRTP